VKFFLDNNLSHLLARALHALCQAEEERIEVVHLSERFDRRTPDAEWIKALAAEGGWVVVSQDRMKKNDLEREALRQSGLIVFALDRRWAGERHWPKSQNMVKWWPAVIEQAKRIEGGAAFRVAWRYTGKFEQIRL